MSLYGYAQKGRLRDRLVEPGLAAFAALVLITAAQAALPDKLSSEPLLRARAAAPSVAPAQPAEPVVLIAFADPVRGYPIVSPFGLRQLPWEAHGRLHEGVDIAAPTGEPILVAADGVVTRAGESPTYGRYVEVQHVEGLVSFYAHMGAIDPAIRSGVALKAGTRLGLIGNSGTSTGPHLHFEIRDGDDRPLNPQAFLGRSFASADALPVSQAARFSGRVRMAHVSRIPDSKRDLMQARLESKSGGKIDPVTKAPAESWMDARLQNRERVRAQIRMIAESQHQETAPAAGEPAVPAAAVAPINLAPPPLDLKS